MENTIVIDKVFVAFEKYNSNWQKFWKEKEEERFMLLASLKCFPLQISECATQNRLLFASLVEAQKELGITTGKIIESPFF